MSNKESTILEEKKKLKKEGIEKNNENDWAEFGISIVKNIVTTLIIGILGANFIYLTTAESISQNGSTLLEYLFPTLAAQYLPTTTTSGGTRCSKDIGHNTNFKLLNKIGVGTTNSWPYSIYKNIDNLDKKDKNNTYTQQFKNWFAQSTAESYKTNRSLLQQWLKLFALNKGSDKDTDENIFSNESFQMFVASPLTFLMFPLVIFFTYFYSWFSMFKMDWRFALIGMFLIYSWIIPFGISFVQTFQYMFALMFLPLFADIKRVKKIFGCNVKGLSIFFGLLICNSAFSHLDNTISITMFVVYLLMIIKMYW